MGRRDRLLTVDHARPMPPLDWIAGVELASDGQVVLVAKDGRRFDFGEMLVEAIGKMDHEDVEDIRCLLILIEPMGDWQQRNRHLQAILRAEAFKASLGGDHNWMAPWPPCPQEVKRRSYAQRAGWIMDLRRYRAAKAALHVIEATNPSTRVERDRWREAWWVMGYLYLQALRFEQARREGLSSIAAEGIIDGKD